MISLQKERRILELLGGRSERAIANQVGVSRDTVRAVRVNHVTRDATRATLARQEFSRTGKRTKLNGKYARQCPGCLAKITTLPCVYCGTLESHEKPNASWVHDLKMERLLGSVGKEFVRIARDIINLDEMRVIHHSLFASLVRQSRDALKLLPEKEDGNE